MKALLTIILLIIVGCNLDSGPKVEPGDNKFGTKQPLARQMPQEEKQLLSEVCSALDLKKINFPRFYDRTKFNFSAVKTECDGTTTTGSFGSNGVDDVSARYITENEE